VQKPKPPAESHRKRQVTEGRRSTLYNPIRTSLADIRLADQLCPYFDTLSWPERPQFSQLWDIDSTHAAVDSTLGSVPKGSVLSYQQPVCISTDSIIFHPGAPAVPDFTPSDLSDFLKPFFPLTRDSSIKYHSFDVSDTQIRDYEFMTRSQSDSDLWHSLRRKRITATKMKDICTRRRDFGSLASRMLGTRHIQTAAMKYGVENEPRAAQLYAQLFGVNVYQCGFVIHPQCCFLGCSPDRRVYNVDDVAMPWGLLEIKCTTANSVADCDYLKCGDKLQLKRNHGHYYQIMAQMGLTGSRWCDFFVLSPDDYHCERIFFDDGHPFFIDMMEKVVGFFFMHFMQLV